MLRSGSVEIEADGNEAAAAPPWKAVHRELKRTFVVETQILAEQVLLLPRAEMLRIWEPLGYAHMLEYMERELGLAPRPAIERLRMGRALVDLPAMADAFAAGTLCYSVVRELTRVAVPATEQRWLEAARDLAPKQIEELVSGRKQGDLPDAPRDPDLVLRTITLRLTPPKIALLRQMQAETREGLGSDVSDDDLVEGLWRRFNGADGQADRPAYQITLHECDTCGRAWQDTAGVMVEVDAATLACAHCDHDVIGRADDETPPRRTSTISPRRRKQVLARDRHRCVVPGCRSTRYLDVHHVVFQSRGGRHKLSNLVTLCAGHHRRLHDGRLEIEGRAPDKLTFTYPRTNERDTHVGTRPHTHVGTTPLAGTTSQVETKQTQVPVKTDTHVGTTSVPDTHVGTQPGANTHMGTLSAGKSVVDTHVGTKPAPDTHVGMARTMAPVETHVRARHGIPRVPPGARLLDAEAHVALKTAGFGSTEAAAAVARARALAPDTESLEHLLRESLRIAGMTRRSTA